MHGMASLSNDWVYVLFKVGTKGSGAVAEACFRGNQTLVFCAGAEIEALMRCVGQTVGSEQWREEEEEEEEHTGLFVRRCCCCCCWTPDPAALPFAHQV